MKSSFASRYGLRAAACVIFVLALGCVAFAFWGLFTESGARIFAGVTKLLSIASALCGGFLALVAVVLWRFKFLPEIYENPSRGPNTSFAEFLAPSRLTEVVDIGANPIDGDPPYKQMLEAGYCRVTGFEPQEDALLKLQTLKGTNERYLPYAVGDGNTHTLNICVASGMTSLFEPDYAALGLFDELRAIAGVTRRIPLATRRLDDMAEIDHLDFLKIDIQGGELAVFKAGAGKLSRAVAVQTEVSFVTLYKNQPTLGEVDLELRRLGFMPHCFNALKHWPISPCVVDGTPRKPLNQILEADLVYVRDMTRPELIDNEQLKHLALIAHYCYRSYDLALRCIMLLEQRGALKPGAQQQYMEHFAT